MEDLILTMAGTLTVTENNVHDEHPYFSSYKNRKKISESQRNRREAYLEKQTKAKESYRNRFRAIYDPYYPVSDNNCENIKTSENSNNVFTNNIYEPFVGSETNGFTNMDFSKWGVLNKKKKKNKEKSVKVSTSNDFSGYLMFSEWLVDIPHSLSTEWTMVPCPIGKRVLIVALNGSTRVYNKAGHLLIELQTNCPGGNNYEEDTCTILDCIYDKFNKKFFLLDVLYWDKLHFADTPFLSRIDFLLKKFSYSEKLRESENGYTFELLPFCPCHNITMTKMMEMDFEFELDGLLFYHSNGFYTPGQTPLVGWLKPWMLPEILNVSIPEKYIKKRGYFKSSQQFIDRFNKEHNFKSSIVKTDNSNNNFTYITPSLDDSDIMQTK